MGPCDLLVVHDGPWDLLVVCDDPFDLLVFDPCDLLVIGAPQMLGLL